MTTQIPDRLLYNGETYYLNEELLERYFRTFPEKKPEIEISMTALWRGYVATFEIKDGELFVAEMNVMADMDWGKDSILDLVFPGTKKFEWFSGLIRIDDHRGAFDAEGQGMTFEFLEIRDGNLLQKRVMDYDQLQQFKSDQFEYFKMTEAYEKVFAMWKQNNPGISDERVDELIAENIIFYTREVYAE